MRWIMKALLQAFCSSLFKIGSVEIEMADGRRFTVGNGTGSQVTIRFNDVGAQALAIVDPDLRFGELFMDGRVDITQGTIFDALMLIAENLNRKDSQPWVRFLQHGRLAVRYLRRPNNLMRSRRNVSHHYNLDGRLYSLFLDNDRQYSCAYFEAEGDSLEAAQLAKKRHIAAKLLARPKDKILDIGCGWGGLALYLAKHCGAEVTGLTLSVDQLTVAQKRAAEAHLGGAVNFKLQDYRENEGRYDRIVSVGMFEHVGLAHYDAFFQKLACLLENNGTALIHTIGRATPPQAPNPWIAKYIFPGGYIPSLSEILPSIERAGLFITDIEVLRLHYAETLKAWRERFLARRDEIKKLYDERFCRMWEFYLAGSECNFRVEGAVVFQIQLSKKIDSVPLTRDYIHQAEAKLRQEDNDDSLDS
ncbi:MAG: SAM-dependent methyltransferase [Bdellovibrio sp.]|nr:MAG: SAM-dependent methyltransferase [Bdellovibrio sp.]